MKHQREGYFKGSAHLKPITVMVVEVVVEEEVVVVVVVVVVVGLTWMSSGRRRWFASVAEMSRLSATAAASCHPR